MRRVSKFFLVAVSLAALATRASSAEPPGWAYPVALPGATAAPDDGSLQHVPDSTVALTLKQIAANGTPVADWHPAEHPPMPDIVAKGRKPQVMACGYCHLPSGAGRPENTSLAGLTPAYIKEQVRAFRNGDRRGSEPRRGPQTFMAVVANAVTDEELDAAAAYFASVTPTSFMKVTETTIVPQTFVAGWILTRAPGGGTEPIGRRIIEIPEDLERFEHRDSRTPYLVYVPVGSLKKGARIVATGNGDMSLRCAGCHGAELKGLGDIPRLAGRSPSYLMRQLYDLSHGKRTGASSLPMQTVVKKLSEDDMLAVAAYLASLQP